MRCSVNIRIYVILLRHMLADLQTNHTPRSKKYNYLYLCVRYIQTYIYDLIYILYCITNSWTIIIDTQTLKHGYKRSKSFKSRNNQQHYSGISESICWDYIYMYDEAHTLGHHISLLLSLCIHNSSIEENQNEF